MSQGLRVLRHRMAALVAAVAVAASAAVAVTPPAPAAAADVTLVPHRIIGFPGHAGLYGWGATTMRDGSVLIGDYWNLRVLHYATDGTYLGEFIDNPGFGATQHQAPYGLAVDPANGDVYMADTDRYQVDRYSETGQYLNSFGVNGVSGNTPGKFQYPSRVAVHNGYVYVSDTWANRIVVYTPTGTVEQFSFGTRGSANGQFKQPRAIDFDANGQLFVADHGNKRIQVFDVDPVNKTATFVRKFGKKYNAAVVSPPGDAVIRGDMRGLVVDDAENVVYLVDAEGNKVHKFSTAGAYLGTFGNIGPKGTEPGRFWDGGREITIDGAGHLWVGDMPNFRVQIFDKDGNFLFLRPDPPEPPADGGFNGPRGAAVDAAGNIFVSDTYNQRVQKLAPDGSFVAGWGRRGRDDYSFNYARTIAVDPTDQSVVLVDTDNSRIKSYTNSGVFQWESGTSGTALGQFQNPHGIDVGADGRIYVGDTNNARVQVLAHDGTPLYMFGTNGTAAGQFKRPRGVVVDDSSGHIYVADATREVVQEFTNTGTYLRSFGGPGTAPDKLKQAFDVEVDADNLYVSDTIDNSIKVWAKSDGRFLGRFGGGGTKLGQLRDPQGMELVNGHLYVAERYNDRVTDFSIVTDTAPPSVTIDAPPAPLPAGAAKLTGTATDDGAVAGVTVQIEDPNTATWWQANGTWGASPVSFTATVTGAGTTSATWSYTWPGPAGNFVLHAVATDALAHPSAPAAQGFATATDVAEPDTVITSPANNAVVGGRPVPILGIVTDDLALSRVQIAVQDRTTKLWWDASLGTWVGSLRWIETTVVSPGGTASGWSYVFDDSAVPGTGLYYAQVRAIDAAGRIETTKPTVRFSI